MAVQTQVRTIPEMPEAGTLRLRGSVTYREVPELRRTILDVMTTFTGKKFVLELGAVEAMDTAGAAVLAEALRFGLDRGKRVLLCSPSESVMRIFELAGFHDVLNHCCADPQETWRRLQLQ